MYLLTFAEQKLSMCSCSGEHAYLLQSETMKTNIGQAASESVKC